MISYFSNSSDTTHAESWVRPNPSSALHTISSVDEREVYESTRQAEQPAPRTDQRDAGSSC